MICLQKIGRHFVWAMLLVCVFSANGADKITKQPEKIEIEKVSLTQLGEMITTITGGTEKSLDAKSIEQIVSKFSQGETLKHLKMLAKGSDEAAKVAAIFLRIADAYQKGTRGDALKNIAIEEIKSYGWDKLKGNALETLAKKIGPFAIIKKANGAVAATGLMYDGSKYLVYFTMSNLSEETMNKLEDSLLTEIADKNDIFWSNRDEELEGLKKDITSLCYSLIDTMGGYPKNPDDFKKNAEKKAQLKQKTKSPKIKFIDINDPQWINTVEALSLDGDDLKTQWAVLTEDFIFYDPYTKRNYTIPAGFVFDGVSVPMKGVKGWGTGAITVGGGPWFPDALPAGLIHDYLYRNPNIWTRDQADNVFYEYLVAAGFPAPKKYYDWLHFFGGKNAHQKHVDNYNAGHYAIFGTQYYRDNLEKINPSQKRSTSLENLLPLQNSGSSPTETENLKKEPVRLDKIEIVR